MTISARAAGSLERRPKAPPRSLVVTAVVAVVLGMLTWVPGPAVAAPVGNGFVVNAADLGFILKQIQIAERHAATLTPANSCRTQLGTAPDQIPNELTSYGLRTVDGSCNNLFAGRETFAAADTVFPRLTTPDFRPAEVAPPGFPGAGTQTTYKGAGNVTDSQPRVVSNLIVDQTSTNPAAVAAAGNPVRTQNNPGVLPCKTDPDPTATPPVAGDPVDCIPSHQTLFIPNVTTDVGLSPPYNSLFTFFGQFFDHGVDQTVKSGKAVFVPLKADDPLIAGPDHIAGNADDLPPSQRFMVLTRAQNQPGPDKVLGTADDVQDATNTDSPWVDQSQTYTSHSSHQVFLREYTKDAAGHPVSTGRFLGGVFPVPAPDASGTIPDTGISTWATTKAQAKEMLGLQLTDKDVTNIPMLATDPYGNFLPGPNGLPQYVTQNAPGGPVTLVEGNLANAVPVPANVVHFDTPFLTDIAHNADPSPVDTNNDGTPDTAPTPDTDSTATANFASQPPGTYDDEMLNAHFTCGDGRCNENIALSAIHQVFHSEHNRLVKDITSTLNDPANTTLKAAFQASHVVAGVAGGRDMSFGFGGRLFQAARFVTEMEYQHLVFEEFARKVQPAIRPFHVYSPDVNPAIEAEFAHAVYRFGHSMLDDLVARNTVDPATGKVTADTSLPLLTAFLNPPMYFGRTHDPDGNPTGTRYTAEEAAGAIVMGSSDQVGNELDEFVTETLRNNLLGLPLDLPTINMARAREAGVPRLNDVRRKIFADTNDGQLTPYTNWSDFGQHLKHPESLINYVAAYGTHPNITGATTFAAKRDAARAIVNPRAADPTATPPIVADVPPADAGDFMFGTDGSAACATCRDWRDVGGKTVTGLDDVDLWVGGLGEVTNLFGGLLGSTFNYVFQTQLEKLQDGDRLYYLARTPGMNLRTQLEGNSFSEMIERNTGNSTNTLKADAFATADCKFQMSFLNNPANSPATAVVPATTPPTVTGAGSIKDDPATTDCDENQLLLKQPNGEIQYRQRNAVDPPGINGQSVYNGTPAVDRVRGGNDNDTIWGDASNDVIDGQGGDDVVLAGDGNDIITDLDGADTPKGGPGNDAIDAGPGDDIPMGNEGQDFINGGANDNETFAGPGTDFINAGQGADAVFGDSGDDWIQGGTGQDLLQGDHGAPFFDDPSETAPGNDVFVGQNGENDYDAEGGDDLMAQNSFVDRNAGAGGYDWAIHQYNTVAADDDMEINNNLPGLPIEVVVLRDRWQETEADSGWDRNDVIKGTSVAPSTLGGAGFTGCDVLDPAGVARVAGLNRLVTTFPTPLPPIVTASAAGFCPLTGQGGAAAGQGTVWGEGDILLGGKGSDTITPRGANDIVDGDHALSVRISYRSNPADPATETGSTDLMENKAIPDPNKVDPWGSDTTGMTLQQAVFAGKTDPGNLVIVRQIDMDPATATAQTTTPADCGTGTTVPTTAVNCDTAVFTAARATYTVTPNANGSVTVDSNGGADGVDTLWNIERLQFSDGPVTLGPTVASTIPAANATGVAVANNITATFAQAVQGVSGTTFTLRAAGATTNVAASVTFNATTLVATLDPTANLASNTQYTATLTGGATAIRDLANNPLANPTTWSFTTGAAADTTAPTVNARVPAAGATGVAVTSPVTATFSENVQGVSGTSFTLKTTAGASVTATVAYNATTRVATLTPSASLAVGTQYTATLTGGATAIRDAAGNSLATSTWNFTTAAAADTAAPTVTARAPAINATGVPVAGNVTATFSEAVQSVTNSTFVIRPTSGSTNLGAGVSRVGTTNQWTLDPTADLSPNTGYTVTLTGGTTGIRDLAGNPLSPVTWAFTTGADTSAPTVIARTPLAGSTGVSRTANIDATFSEAVQGVNGASFSLKVTSTNTAVGVVVSRNGTTNQWIQNPAVTLAANTQYTVTLTGNTTNVRDMANNPLATTTWTFTTGAN